MPQLVEELSTQRNDAAEQLIEKSFTGRGIDSKAQVSRWKQRIIEALQSTDTMKLISYLALFLASSSALLAADPKAGSLWSPSGTNVTITAGDDIPDPISVIPVGVDSPNFSFVITDSESNVLMYTTKNVIDLDGAPPGTCRVYGFAWAGDFDRPTGGSVHDLTASEGQAVSKNRVSITRVGADSVDGGIILNDRNRYGRIRLYLGDNPSPFRVYTLNKASTDTNYAFVITDAEGSVLAFPEDNIIDLSGAPPGTCQVYGISFTGELNKTTGIHVSEVTSDTDNQSLSKNSVRADRLEGSKPERKPRRWRWWRW